MRLLIAALAITFTVAIGASVVATWASVADAPWEDEVVVVDNSDAQRCDGALEYRNTIIEAGEYGRENRAGLKNYSGEMDRARKEVNRYC